MSAVSKNPDLYFSSGQRRDVDGDTQVIRVIIDGSSINSDMNPFMASLGGHEARSP